MEERPLVQRLLALLAVVALLAAGGVSAWWILTDQIHPPERAAPARPPQPRSPP